jgi:hypothetical protein
MIGDRLNSSCRNYAITVLLFGNCFGFDFFENRIVFRNDDVVSFYREVLILEVSLFEFLQEIPKWPKV